MIEDRKTLHKTIAGALIAFIVLAALYVGLYFARSHYSKYGDPPLKPGQAWTSSNFWTEETGWLFENYCRRFPTDFEARIFRPLVALESQIRGHRILVETWHFEPTSDSWAYTFD